MKTIIIKNGLSTGLDSAFDQVSRIDIQDQAFAEGGFGEVFYCLKLSNSRPQHTQVIKLFFDQQGAGSKGLRTIQGLQRVLGSEHRDLLKREGTSLIDKYPALIACPQFSFEGTINGKPVIGYAANNLIDLGFVEFGELLEDSSLLQQYQTLEMGQRKAIAFHLVNAFDLLRSRMFIHADFKAEALFIHPGKFLCAIIDFDSGAIMSNPQDKPTTFGAFQDWLAPEILKQISDAKMKGGNQTGRTEVKVDLMSDMWSVAIGVHYLLFTVHPFFFLTEISDRSIEAYFRMYSFPEANPGFRFFRKDYSRQHTVFQKLFATQLSADIQAKFSNTFGKGFSNASIRTSYRQWMVAFGQELKELEITSFVASRKEVLEGEVVTLKWELNKRATSEIDHGIGDVTAIKQRQIVIGKSTEFILTARDELGTSKRARAKVTAYPKPSLSVKFAGVVKANEPLTIAIQAQNCRKVWMESLGSRRVEILTGQTQCTIKGFASDEVLIFKAEGALGSSLVLRRQIKVCHPVAIVDFCAVNPMVIETLTTQLKWKVTNADELYLNGISVKGDEIEVKPLGKTRFILVARNSLFEKQETLEVDVFPLPVEPSIRVPQPPEFSIEVPDLIIETAEPDDRFSYQQIWD